MHTSLMKRYIYIKMVDLLAFTVCKNKLLHNKSWKKQFF